MGKTTGFIEYKRELPAERPPLERIKDWNEFHLAASEENQKIQGARCMNCGIPFCHSGLLMNNMASGCPINNLIPEWNDLIYKGLWSEAVERLLKTNNFPEFTGRVCPAPCEGACTLGINQPQVTIKANENALIERAFSEGWIKPRPPIRRTGKTVAVIGSGPSGLACAHQLNKAGHSVTVFERNDRPGGLLMYGIPNMKLDKQIVQRRIDLMKEEGINFVLNTEICVHVTPDEINNNFDAVILCGGASKPRDLAVDGRQLKGIRFAMDFLHANTKSFLDSNHQDNSFISAKDQDVVIIGGGDTGTDCVATSLRHGCRSIKQFEILPMPPLERLDDNPWPEWPKIFKTDYGQQEAKALYGADPREYCILTKKFSGDGNGHISEIHTINIEWVKDDNGRFVPIEIPDTEKVWPAQLVLLSMGFLGPEDTLPEAFGVSQDSRSNVKAEYGKFSTTIKGVFAAGDMRRGQSLVVWAINEGRGAARECDRFLMGNTNLP